MISIIIPTKNEERNIAACLEALSWSDDIVVLDAFSTDRTVDLARQHGARVIQKDFASESDRQNFIVEGIPFKHPWVYHSDADEIVPDDLRDELLAVVKQEVSAPTCSAYRLRYRNHFMGRWIRHCSTYPVWVTRLFMPGRIRWQRLINTIPVVDGRIGELKCHFDHYSFNNGLEAWFAKHNRYSTHEAIEGGKMPPFSLTDVRCMFCGAYERRQALKTLAFSLPFRPEIVFVYRYLFRLGFLDGYPGFLFCRMMACYETMIVAKQAVNRHQH